jgi:hypothetical protein
MEDASLYSYVNNMRFHSSNDIDFIEKLKILK